MKIRTASFVILFYALLAVSGPNTPLLHAEARLNTGCMMESSPFYQKLLNAGVLNIPVTQPVGQAESLKILFAKAHLFRYTSDLTEKEDWQSAEETAKLFKGDCADKAIYLYTHMRQNGYKGVSLVIGRYSPSSRVLHMWVTYDEPSGNKLLLDPTMHRKPWKVADFSKRYYKPLYALNGQDCIAF